MVGVLVELDPGIPLYLMSGVATSEHGLKWGDGWTAFQPVNTGLAPDKYSSACTVNGGNGECCTARCPVGKIGDATTGTCLDTCGTSLMVSSGDCSIENVASNSYRDTCTCNACNNGKLGDSCEYANITVSEECHGEGWKTLVGTQHGYGNGNLATGTGGQYFRCGGCDFNTNTPNGWYGNCVVGAGECNGVANCGDGSDEANCEGFSTTCKWPKAKLGGICKECTVGDVDMDSYPHYASCTEAFTNADQDACTCIKGVPSCKDTHKNPQKCTSICIGQNKCNTSKMCKNKCKGTCGLC